MHRARIEALSITVALALSLGVIALLGTCAIREVVKDASLDLRERFWPEEREGQREGGYEIQRSFSLKPEHVTRVEARYVPANIPQRTPGLTGVARELQDIRLASEYHPAYSVVRGELRNPYDVAFFDVRITIVIRSATGQFGTVTVETGYIGPGERWSFRKYPDDMSFIRGVEAEVVRVVAEMQKP